MNTRGRKIEFAEMVNPHMRITGRITTKSTMKKKRALSLDNATLPHYEANKKVRRWSNAGQAQPSTPNNGSKEQQPGPSLLSAERSTESDTSSLAENSPNQSKSCDFKLGRISRKTRPSEVMIESAVLNSPERERESSTTSSTSTQTKQNQREELIPDEMDGRRLKFDSSSTETTPPVGGTTPVEPDTSRRSLRTNRSRDYKFLAGLCSENHFKRKLLEIETVSRRTLDGNQAKSSGRNAKRARLEREVSSTPEPKVSRGSVNRDEGVRMFENKDIYVSSEAENVIYPVTVKTEIEDEGFSLIPDSPAVKLEEMQSLMCAEAASEVGGQSASEFSVKLENVDYDDLAQEKSGGEEDTVPPTETSIASAPVNSPCSVEICRETSLSAECQDINSQCSTKVSDIEPPVTDSAAPSKCPYKDPKLLCLIEKLNSEAKTPSCLNSPVAEVGGLLEEQGNSEAAGYEVIIPKLEEIDVKPTHKELGISDDSDDRCNTGSAEPLINELEQHKRPLSASFLESQEISRSRIDARKSFKLSLARAVRTSSPKAFLAKRLLDSSVDCNWNSNIKPEKVRKAREGRAASSDFVWNSDVNLESESRGSEKCRLFDHPLKQFTSGEKCSYTPTSSHDTSIDSLFDQKQSVFVSQNLDKYLASSPFRRESVQREADEPEVDEIDGFTFIAFPSQNSLEKHTKKLNIGILNASLSSSRRSIDGFGSTDLATSDTRTASSWCKREALLKSGKVKKLSIETLNELCLEINIDPSDLLSAEPSADESMSCTAKITRRGIAKMGNEKRQPRKGKIYGRKVTGRFASKANIKYHVKKTSPNSFTQSNLKGKKAQVSSSRLGAPVKRDASRTGSYGVDWRPVLVTMKMAIAAVRALSIESAAVVPCNQTDCTCSGKKGMQPEYEPGVSSESFLVHLAPSGPSCLKEHCRLGCVCDSLKTPPKRTIAAKAHCGRPDCMFGCDCLHITRSKALRLCNSDSEASGREREAAVLVNSCKPGPKKRKRRGWGIPIEEDLWQEQGNSGDGGNSLRKSNRIKERPQLQDFKKLRKMIYDDIYEWENDEQLRPKRRKMQKLLKRDKVPKVPKYLRRAAAAAAATRVGSVVVASAPAALGRLPSEATTPIIVKTEPPTFEISDDDVKIVSPDTRKNGRMEVVPPVSGVTGSRNDGQKMVTSETAVHVAPSTAARESTMVVSEDELEEADDLVTSCARTMVYRRKQGFTSLVATQNFPRSKTTDASHPSRSLSMVQEKYTNATNTFETKQRVSAALTKPSLSGDSVAVVKLAPSGVGIFTRSVILVKKETGRGKPEERKPAVVLNMSYNVPLEHCKEMIASKVYGMWTEGLAVVGRSFEYENLLVEFLPKSDKEIQIPPHIRDTINPDDVHEITIRITKRRENRRNPPLVQKSTVSEKVPVIEESIGLSGLKNFVSGGVFDSASLATSNAGRLATSCVLGPFAADKSTVCARTVFPPLLTTDDESAVAETVAMESGINIESSPEAQSRGKVAAAPAVHWKSTTAEEKIGSESMMAEGALSGTDEALDLISEWAVNEAPEPALLGGSAELQKLLLAEPTVDVTCTSTPQPIAFSEVEVSSGRKPSQEEALNLVAASADPVLVSIPSGGSASSLASTPSMNTDPIASRDQLVIANTFKINPKTFDSLPSTGNPVSSASTKPGFQLISVSATKNSLINSFRVAPSMVRPILVSTSTNPTGLIVSTSGSLPRSGLVTANRIHLAPPLSLPVAVCGRSGPTQKSASFLVVPKTMVTSLVKTGSTAAGSLLPAQQMVPSNCLVVTNPKLLKIGVPVSSTGSVKGESLMHGIGIPGKTNSSFVQVKPVSTSASGQQRLMLVSTAEMTNRPRPSAPFVLKQGGKGVVQQQLTSFAGQCPAKDVIEIKDDSDEERGGHDEEIDILCSEADGSNEAAILSEKLGIRLENFASSQPGMTIPMPPPTQAPQKQKRKQMHEEKAEFSTNDEITEGWVRIPAEENKTDPTPPAVPSTVSIPSGEAVETEMAIVEEALDMRSQPSRPAAVQPNLYIELYRAITPYLKQTDKTKKKKISPLYITRKATQVIKRITEWQNVLLNDLLNERMIYDKLKKRHEKLSAAAAEGKSDITSEPSVEQSASSTNPVPSERRRVPGPLRRKFRGVSRKDETECLINRTQEDSSSLAGDTAAVAGDTGATGDAVTMVNVVAMGDAVVIDKTIPVDITVTMDTTNTCGDDASAGDDSAIAAGAGCDLDAIASLIEGAAGEQNADSIVNRNGTDASRRDKASDSSAAIKTMGDDHSCGTVTDVSVRVSCDSVNLTCALNEKESLQGTLASADCTEQLQCTDSSDEVMTNNVGEVVECALTYDE